MARLFNLLGRPREALALCDQALSVAEQVGDLSGIARIQSFKAGLLKEQGKYQEALSLYAQALQTQEELGDVHGVAVTQSSMADVLVILNRLQEALALSEKALQTMKELGDVRGVTVTQGIMAYALFRLGRLQEALALYRQALQVSQELGDVRGVAVTQSEMARVLLYLGQLREALALYEQALQSRKLLGDFHGVAVTQQAMADVLRLLDQPQEALSLYEQAQQTHKDLGDVRGVAVTQSAMARVLIELGQPQEALALLEQALHTRKELGNNLDVAETQVAIAELLSQQGRPQEAQALYEEALQTQKDLGNIQGAAVTQTHFCLFLLEQDEPGRALALAWEAYTALRDTEFSFDTQSEQELLIMLKGRVLGPEKFNMLWEDLISEAQPDWLQRVKVDSSPQTTSISPKRLEVFVANTVAVMTVMPEKYNEWHQITEEALRQAKEEEQLLDIEFFTAILALLDGQIPLLTEGHPHATALTAIKEGIAAGSSAEVIQTVREYVNAKDWEATRQVIETKQAILFRPEVETHFEQNIARAKSAQNERAVRLLEIHLALLRKCKAESIEAAFQELFGAQEDEISLDTELILRSITALLGSPEEKIAHMQYLTTRASETTDANLKALLQVIQLALFSSDLSKLGSDLQGLHRQTWEAITASVETFTLIIKNTLATLGLANEQRSEWRNNLAEFRNQATVDDDRNMVSLLDAVIGLLDAGGNPTGLGEELKGVYAKTWMAIVDGLEGYE